MPAKAVKEKEFRKKPLPLKSERYMIPKCRKKGHVAETGQGGGVEKLKKPSAKSPEKQSCRDSRIDIEIRELKKELEMYKLIFNNVHHGCELTDNKGYITHFNEIYKRFLRLEPKTRKIKPSFLV